MKNSKKIKSILIALLCIIPVVFTFSGCDMLLDALFGATYYKDEDLLYLMKRHSLEYEYSNRARITISHRNDDILTLKDESDSRNSDDDNKNFFEYGQIVLSGSFVKHAWNDYKLFILMDDVYYVYDLKNAPATSYDEEENFLYELKEYSEDEFIKLYPEQDTFEWELLDTRRDVVLKGIGISLPESAEFTESEDTRVESTYYRAGYFYATIELQDDDETEKFIKKIKKEWVKPPIVDANYKLITDYWTSDNEPVPLSDNYYYLYSYSGESNGEGKYTIATFDEENKTIYFYTSEIY